MSKVVHFEIPADDTVRAKGFYEKVFDWKIDTWDGPVEYHLVTAGTDEEPGINGAIMQRGDNQSIVNTIQVDSVDEYSRRIEEAGGKIVLPKMAVPGVGWMAYFEDTEGNKTGIMAPDESAK